MARYEVQWRYGSSIGGPWVKGEVVEIDSAEIAEAINRDSPGVLKPVKEKTAKAGSNRMVTVTENRADPGSSSEATDVNSGIMTKADFLAVKDE